MTHRGGLPWFSVSGLYQLKCTHTVAFPVSSAGGEAQATRAHRQAFPTPRGATGGCPPDTVCGGRPRDPRGDGKIDPKGGVAGHRKACATPSENLGKPPLRSRMRPVGGVEKF